MSWTVYRTMTWILAGVVLLLFLWNMALTAALPASEPTRRDTNYCDSIESMERFQEEHPSLGLYCH